METTDILQYTWITLSYILLTLFAWKQDKLYSRMYNLEQEVHNKK